MRNRWSYLAPPPSDRLDPAATASRGAEQDFTGQAGKGTGTARSEMPSNET